MSGTLLSSLVGGESRESPSLLLRAGERVGDLC